MSYSDVLIRFDYQYERDQWENNTKDTFIFSYIAILTWRIERDYCLCRDTIKSFFPALKKLTLTFPLLQLQQLRLLQGMKTYRDLGMTYHHVYHPGDIQVSGKTQKNIVAFDQDGAYTLADSKKRPLSANSELKNNMVLPAVDVCADFAISVSMRHKKTEQALCFKNVCEEFETSKISCRRVFKTSFGHLYLLSN